MSPEPSLREIPVRPARFWRESSTPPGPEGHGFSGHLAELRDDILGFFTRCERSYGGIVGLRLYWEPFYLVSDPDLIQRILVTDHHKFVKPTGLQVVKPMFGEGLLTSDGDRWRQQRDLIQPAFYRESIHRYARIAVEGAQKLLDAWRPNEGRDIHAEMNQLTLDIVARSLFGTDVTAGREVITAGARGIQEFFNAWRQRYLPPMPEWLPLPALRKLKRVVRELDVMVDRIIDARRTSTERSDDLLSMLLEARHQDGSAMSRRQVRDELVTLFLAGHETTAASLSWAWYLLSQDPRVLQAVHAELDGTLGGRMPSVEDLPNLPYLDKVFKEVLRLYPSAYNIGRVTKEACEVGGYPIARGRNLIMCQWAVQRSPRYYHDPDAFRPERWDPSTAKKLPKFAYFPFGAGPRNCIGAQFATMEAKLILASIAQRYELELAPGAKVAVDPAITIRPAHGLPMIVRRRSPATAGIKESSKLPATPRAASPAPEGG
jgi:cytochrome P450